MWTGVLNGDVRLQLLLLRQISLLHKYFWSYRILHLLIKHRRSFASRFASIIYSGVGHAR